MLKAVIKEHVVKPALRRVGTAGAVLIVAGGDWLCQHYGACGLVNQPMALAVMEWVAAAALVAYDLFASYIERTKRKAVR